MKPVGGIGSKDIVACHWYQKAADIISEQHKSDWYGQENKLVYVLSLTFFWSLVCAYGHSFKNEKKTNIQNNFRGMLKRPHHPTHETSQVRKI